MDWRRRADELLTQLSDKDRIYKEIKKEFPDVVRNEVRDYLSPKTIEVQKTKNILHLSDLHIPFNLDVRELPEAQKYVGKVDTIILNGDIQDCQSISKFSKKYRQPLVEEMIMAWEHIPELFDFFQPDEMIVNYGNHEMRLSAYVSDKLNDDVAELMPNTPLDLIIDDGFFRYDKRGKTKTYYEPLSKLNTKIRYSGSWFNQIGGTIFCHPKAYKNPIMGTSEKAFDYFIKHGYKFDTIVLAHTHKLAMTRYGTQCFLIEGGSLCEEMDYTSEGSLSRPQNKGFVFMKQDEEGQIIKDSIKLEYLNL